jgi:hypothetical protein
MSQRPTKRRPTLGKMPPSNTYRTTASPDQLMEDIDVPVSLSITDDNRKDDPNQYSSEIALKSFGYTPVQRVLIDGEYPVNYLKCQSPLGFYIYVLVDDGKIVSFNSNNLTAKEMVKGEVLPIPDSLASGFYHDSGNVMVVCNQGMCQMSHDGAKVDPVVTNFSLVSESRSRLVVPEGSFLAYPLVTMNELKANPKSVLTSTTIATNRLREIAYLKCHEQIRLFISRLNVLASNTNRFTQLQHETASKLDTYIKAKTAEQLSITATPPKSSIVVEQQWNNLYNLNLRHSMIIKFLSVCSHFGELADKINEINAEIESLNEMMHTEFTDIEIDRHRPKV